MDGKRVVVNPGTGTVSGTYTEVIVENVTDNDVESVKVTEITGTVTRADNYEKTTEYTLNGSFSIYVNGVQIVDDTPIYNDISGIQNDDASCVTNMRMFQCQAKAAVYVKDYYVYEGNKPQQFYTMDGEVPALTDVQSAAPAKASDLKTGFVDEDHVTRYYDELGLPMVNTEFEVGGKTYTANANGSLICDGTNHIRVNSKGCCPGCGAKADGVTSLYATSLVLGSDVQVVFYFDIDTEKLDENAYLEIGLDIDYANGTTQKVYLNESAKMQEIGGNTYYVVSYAVSAKDIYADVKVRPVTGSGLIGTLYTASAADYAQSVQLMQTDETYTEELKALARALLVYGKNASAALLGTETVNIDDSAVSFEGITGSGNADSDEIVKLSSFTLELKSNVKIKIYFTFDAVIANDEYDGLTIAAYTVKVDGEAVEITHVKDNVYCAEFEVVAKDLSKNFNIAIGCEAESTGMNLTISALYYAKVMNGNAEASAEYKNLMKAIKLYSDAAVAYADGTAEESRPLV